MSELISVTAFTIGIGLLSTLLILPVGLPLAWWLARRQWRGKVFVETLITLPLVVPPVATGLILLKLFGRQGWIGHYLENNWGIEVVFTWKAVVLATAVMSAPLFIRTARVAFENVSPRLEAVALTLGASRMRMFATVTLPLASRGLIAAAVLSFARALGEFGATIIVAGYIPGETATLALSIYHQVQLGRDAQATGFLIVSVLIAFAAVACGEWFLRRRIN